MNENVSIYWVERFEMNSGEEAKQKKKKELLEAISTNRQTDRQTDRQTIKSNLFTSRCSKTTTVPSAEEETNDKG